jgi:protein TonB
MLEYAGRRTRVCALAVTLALHAGLMLPVFMSLPKVKEKADKLVVVTLGLVTDHQVKEQAATAKPDVAKPPPRKAQQARPKQKTPTPAPPEKLITPQHPVPAPTMAPQPAAAEQTPVSAQNANAPSPIENAPQKPQTIDVRQKDIDALKQYAAIVQKKIQANLVYSAQARKAGHEGSPVIKFTVTESGMILPGSLRVIRSSGYAELDESALNAAHASEPFDRPLHQMEVAMQLGFGQSR